MRWFQIGPDDNCRYVDLEKLVSIDYFKGEGTENATLFVATGTDQLIDVATVTDPDEIRELFEAMGV